MSIPPDVHFCWIGPAIPWAYVFAVLSAAERGGAARVTLHHTEPLVDGPERRALEAAGGVVLAPLDARALLRDVGCAIGVGEALLTLHRAVVAPVARADILRAAILHRDGGIYLDLDTVTVATLRPLLEARHFVGTEFIVWPARARASRSPRTLAHHLALDLVRKACRAWPGGWRVFRRLETFYVRGVNNAVMGAEPASSFIADYLRAMCAVPSDQAGRPYALGPTLLQAVVDRGRDAALTIHEPSVFYPLAPEISEHWFRRRGRADLGSPLSPGTRVVHWYASVRTRALVADITPEYVRAHRASQLYSMLVHSCLPDFFRAAS